MELTDEQLERMANHAFDHYSMMSGIQITEISRRIFTDSLKLSIIQWMSIEHAYKEEFPDGMPMPRS